MENIFCILTCFEYLKVICSNQFMHWFNKQIDITIITVIKHVHIIKKSVLVTHPPLPPLLPYLATTRSPTIPKLPTPHTILTIVSETQYYPDKALVLGRTKQTSGCFLSTTISNGIILAFCWSHKSCDRSNQSNFNCFTLYSDTGDGRYWDNGTKAEFSKWPFFVAAANFLGGFFVGCAWCLVWVRRD